MSERAKNAALFLLRVVAGLLFLQHGGMKLFGWFGGRPSLEALLRGRRRDLVASRERELERRSVTLPPRTG